MRFKRHYSGAFYIDYLIINKCKLLLCRLFCHFVRQKPQARVLNIYDRKAIVNYKLLTIKTYHYDNNH